MTGSGRKDSSRKTARRGPPGTLARWPPATTTTTTNDGRARVAAEAAARGVAADGPEHGVREAREHEGPATRAGADPAAASLPPDGAGEPTEGARGARGAPPVARPRAGVSPRV